MYLQTVTYLEKEMQEAATDDPRAETPGPDFSQLLWSKFPGILLNQSPPEPTNVSLPVGGMGQAVRR